MRIVTNPKTGAVIPYTIKALTYRDFNVLIDRINANNKCEDRVLRTTENELIFAELIDNSEQLLNEALSRDISLLTTDAIEYNQGGGSEDPKKSD